MKPVTVAVVAVALSLAIFTGCCVVPHSLMMFRKDKAASGETPAKEAETWTCSMHPEVRQAAPGKCPVCGMDLVANGPVGLKDDAACNHDSSCCLTMGMGGHQAHGDGAPHVADGPNPVAPADSANLR